MSKFQREINTILYEIKCGDKSKEKELFNVTYNYLKVIALRYAVDKNDWQDILLETYSRALKYIDNFDLTKDGYNWLCKITQNVAYDFNKQVEPNEPLEELKNEEVYFIEDSIVNRSFVTDELSKLPIYEQKLIYLKFWGNLSYSEIAKEVNGKKSTVHKQINTILKKLNKKF